MAEVNNSPLNNNLMLYFLSGLGRSLGGEGSVGDMLGAMNQQNIAAQSQNKTNQQYLKMLQQLLAGGSKVTMDKDNFGIKGPVSALGDKGKDTGVSTPPAATNSFGTSMSFLNPSASSPDISSADLAGLSTEDVSRALAGALGVENLKQQTISDLANRQLRGKEIQQKDRELDILSDYRKGQIENDRLESLRKLAENFRTSPLEVPGLGLVSLDQWEKLDTKTKAYSYYAFDAKQHNEVPMKFNEWDQQVSDPDKWELYKLAQKDKNFDEWLTKHEQAGATRISIEEKAKTAEALADVKSKKYFTSPDGLASDVDKYMASIPIRTKLLQFEGDQLPRARAEEIYNYVTNKITGSGGTIVDARGDKETSTLIWTVKWPDGTTSEVKYGVKSN